MSNLQNKIAVITGAGSGIGKALAIECLHRGMKVVLADKDDERLRNCATELYHFSNQILISVTDVANENDIIDLSHKTMQEFGAVHYLFNNAGIPGALGPIWTQPSSVIEEVIQTNLMGIIYGIKTFVPLMLSQKDECYIVNTSAGAGLLTGPGLSAYKASKHAITAISEVLFHDLKNMNAAINVSVLIPHWVNTDIATKIKTDDASIIKHHHENLKNYGMSPTFVAKTVFEGIEQKRFYIFTALDEHAPKIQRRMENILALKDP